MSTFTYRPAFEKELARSPDLAAVIHGYVDAGQRAARARAPHHTGHYEDTIGSVVGVDAKGIVGSVLSTDFAAGIIEFGSINNPPYAPLRRGVEATGLTVTDKGRHG